MGLNHSAPPTRILVTVRTSSSILDKSNEKPFTITLSARVDHHRPVTIKAMQTVLYSQVEALDYQGLTFRDISTGTYAERRHMDVQRELPDRLTATTDYVVELPPRNAVQAYDVCHTFERLPEYVPDLSHENNLSDEQKILAAGVSQMHDQTRGLTGHTYGIGLGATYMSSVREWREGSKAEVFLHGSMSSAGLANIPLSMELVNVATFYVADESHHQEKTYDT